MSSSIVLYNDVLINVKLWKVVAKRDRKGKLITIKLLDFVHRPDFYKQKTQRFGNWICFRLQARGGEHLLYRKTKSLPFHRRCQNKRRKIVL
jgi:hypothetical protein